MQRNLCLPLSNIYFCRRLWLCSVVAVFVLAVWDCVSVSCTWLLWDVSGLHEVGPGVGMLYVVVLVLLCAHMVVSSSLG